VSTLIQAREINEGLTGECFAQTTSTISSSVIPASRTEFLTHIRQLEALTSKKSNAAAHIVEAALKLWQKKSFPSLALLNKKRNSPWQSNCVVNAFANWLARQDFNEAAYWLATAYANLAGESKREKFSMYFTPPKLAERVIDNLIVHGASLTEHHWHDPACGGAAFLVPVAQRMAKRLSDIGASPAQLKEKIQFNLSGSDIDGFLLSLSTQFILMSLYAHLDFKEPLPLIKLEEIDGLSRRPEFENPQTVIVCNPPYRKLAPPETEKYKAAFGTVFRGQSNIYGLFIKHCIDLTEKGGYIGLLTPTSFLSGHSFSKIRTYASQETEILQIDLLKESSALFISVDQQAAITTLKRHTVFDGQHKSAKIFSLTRSGIFQDVGLCKLDPSGKPWGIPKSPADLEILAIASKSASRLKDYGYSARIGTLVGYRDTRPRYNSGAYRKFNSGKVIVPLVWATDIGQDGSFVHGRKLRKNGGQRFVRLESGTDKALTSKSSVLLQRLTSGTQAKRLVAAVIPEKLANFEYGFVAENHVIVITCFEQKGWSPSEISEIFNSKIVDQIFRSLSSANNVAISELLELPLPDPEALRHHLSMNPSMTIAIECALRNFRGE
jgi:adenine-specific DNA-methyltransferase